jgi:septum formation protein
MRNEFILASGSPRRQQLLKDAGLNFTIKVADVDEKGITSQLLLRSEIEKFWIPEMLAKEKAIAAAALSDADSTIISADTIVLINDKIIGKPVDEKDAILMLQELSNNKHTVITGVCIYNAMHQKPLSIFSEKTEVFFKRLTAEQIQFYIKNYQPFDKAGAYAIQEWIGLIGIEKINGCFYNVMGLPISKLFSELQRLNLLH